MHCRAEEAFDDLYNTMIYEYKEVRPVLSLLDRSWCGPNCNWKSMWPRFGRLFPHGNVDTTNIIERHWQYIKYTALRGRVNHSITCLLHTLIGEASTGTCMGGTVLEWYKQKQIICDSGRFIPRANSKEHASRLRRAEEVVERYHRDPQTIVVLDAARLLFSILSMSKDNIWYTVSVQLNYCERHDVWSTCKHLMGVVMVIERYMTDLADSLPIIAHANGMHEPTEFASDQVEGDENPCVNEVLWLRINDVKERLDALANGMNRLSEENNQYITEKMDDFITELQTCFVPHPIDMPKSGSIKSQQQHVTLNRLGSHVTRVNRVTSMDESIMGSSPPKDKFCKGTMQRVGEWSRKSIRFPKNTKVKCNHCDCNTYISGSDFSLHCVHCEALLPLTNDMQIAILKGKKVRCEIDNDIVIANIMNESL